MYISVSFHDSDEACNRVAPTMFPKSARGESLGEGRRAELTLLNDEGDHQGDPPFGNLVVANNHLGVLHPGALDSADGLGNLGDAIPNCGFYAFC